MMKKWVAIFSSALLAGGAAVGVSASDSGKLVAYEDSIETSVAQDTSKKQEESKQVQEQVTKEEAVKAAQAILDGSLEEVEVDHENGKKIYEVELNYNGEDYDFDVDALTGEVLKIDDDLLKTPVRDQVKVNADEAKQIALELFENAGIKDIDLEMKESRFIYEIEVKVNGEDGDVYIDAMTGEVLYIEDDVRHKVKDEKDNAETTITGAQEAKGSNETKETTAKISSEEAVELALAHVGGGVVEEVELDREDGVLVYEVEIEQNDDKEVEVDINAVTGEVVLVDWD